MNDFFWENLLDYIDDGQLVPIVGRDLLRGVIDGRDLTLDRHLAERLAPVFKAPLAPEAGLNDLASWIVTDLPALRQGLYSQIKLELETDAFPVPPALRQLARIRPFPLIVTTAFDLLLERALREERGLPADRVVTGAFSEKLRTDLVPREELPEDAVQVYHLLGACGAGSGAGFAVTESDALDAFIALFTHRRDLRVLGEVLNRSHLLFLGTDSPDWLARFLLRFAKKDPLYLGRRETEIFVDRRLQADRSFRSFVRQFSKMTQIYDGEPEAFVAELARRWEARARPATTPPVEITAPPDIFVSYAREDLEAARAICERLQAAGLRVWLDKEGLEGGMQFQSEIERMIERCAVFLPVVSGVAHRTRTERRFFRHEWRTAIKQLSYYDERRRFIQPVIVDGISITAEGVSEAFRSLHVEKAPGGRLSEGQVDSIVRSVRALNR